MQHSLQITFFTIIAISHIEIILHIWKTGENNQVKKNQAASSFRIHFVNSLVLRPGYKHQRYQVDWRPPLTACISMPSVNSYVLGTI